MNRLPKIVPGDRVRINVGGIVVSGTAETVDIEYKYASGAEPEIIGYNIEVRSEHTGKIHYWKSRSDGGKVDVL